MYDNALLIYNKCHTIFCLYKQQSCNSNNIMHVYRMFKSRQHYIFAARKKLSPYSFDIHVANISRVTSPEAANKLYPDIENATNSRVDPVC